MHAWLFKFIVAVAMELAILAGFVVVVIKVPSCVKSSVGSDSTCFAVWAVRERERSRQTDRQTDRQTETETLRERQTDRDRERGTE